MALSNELISQFAKLVKEEKKPDNGTIVYGKIIVDSDGQKYVQLDGSSEKTPITETNDDLSKDSSTADVKNDDRVSVLIKNHTATVTGNISSPSVSKENVEKQIQEYDILIGEKLTAQEAYIKQLQVEKANVNDLNAAQAEITKLKAEKAEIKDLEAAQAEITNLKSTKIDASVVEAGYAKIESLDATNAEINTLKTEDAEIKKLVADKVDTEYLEANYTKTESLDAKYANIDFANITQATIENFFLKSGMIENVVIGDTTITGALVGVTFKGDLIEAGTVKADKLVVKGSDGIFYKLNVEAGGISAEQAPTDSLHGSIITASSITAEKISVKDLVAFGATIGGFKITDNSIYSGVKNSVHNTTTGIYQDSQGQFAVGDGTNFFKFFKQDDGSYKLDLSVASIRDRDPIGTVSGKPCVRIDDISSVKHTMKVNLSGKNYFDCKNAVKLSGGALISGSTDNSITVASNYTSTWQFAAIALPDELEGSTITVSGQWIASGSNNGAIRVQWMTSDGGTAGSMPAFTQTSGLSASGVVPKKPEGAVYLALLLYSNVTGTTNPGDTVEYTNIQVELGTEATEYEPYQLVSAVNVKTYGKNLATVNSVQAPFLSVQTVIFEGKLCGKFTLSWKNNLSDLNNTSSALFGWKYADGTIGYDVSIAYSKRFVVFDNEDIVQIFILNYCGAKSGSVDDIQLELGTEATEYEPYKEPVTYYVNEDGSVIDIKSVYPSVTIVPDTPYVTVDCEYYKNNVFGDEFGSNDALEGRIKSSEESIAALTVDTNRIVAEVQKNTTLIDESKAGLDARLKVVEEKASVSVDEAQVKIAIEKELSENGAPKVVTKTGYEFTDDGMMVHKSNSEMKTQVSDNGMTVYQRTGSKINEETEVEEPVFVETLQANNKGVVARNLNASTYLIFAEGRGRFQKYDKNGEKRIACYWLGG